MSETERGIVINVNAYGATVRLDDGRLASAPAADVEKHRGSYDRALISRRPLEFMVQGGKHPLVLIAPQLHDEQFETQINRARETVYVRQHTYKNRKFRLEISKV